MNNSYQTCIAVLCVAVPALLAVWGSITLLRVYLDVAKSKAALILLLSFIAGVGATLIRFQQVEIPSPMGRWSNSSDTAYFVAIFAGLLTVVTMVFLVQFHSKWIAGRLTDGEKKPGLDGARAWLGPGNIICVVLISLLAWLSFDYSPFAVALLGLLALVAYPAMKSASTHLQAPPPPEVNASERQRVLNMLDSGKITASEGAELLSALSLSEKPRATRSVAVVPEKLALIGAVLLLIGFFLPWFSINAKSELDRLIPALPNQFLPDTPTIRISGGDVQHGLGWLVLILGVAAAALPYLAGNMEEQIRRRAVVAGLGLGAIILLYLVTQNLRFVSIGILLAVVGYGLQLACALQSGRLGSHAAN
jgi:hypothetical protein